MRYRTKLLLLFIALAVVTNSVSVGWLYLRARADLFDQINTTALSIAGSLASQVDPAQHRSVSTRDDETSAPYLALVRQFRAVRDANRRDDVHVKFVYSFRPVPGKPGSAVYVIDAEENGEDKSHVGDPYIFKEMDEYPPDFQKPQVLPVLVEDQWGTWLSATAPLLDPDGESFGAVGVDISATDVVRQLRTLLFGGLISLLASLVLAVALAFLLSRHVARPLADIRDAAAAIGNGDLTARVAVSTHDEFAEVGGAINEMAIGLLQRENLKATLVRYVSQEVADEILASGHLPDLETQRRKITVLFADMRGFTRLSENMSPEEIVLLLNRYFDRMIETVFRNKGYLNKFIGDGLMAVFGAPLDDPYQEEHAVRAALEMCDELRVLEESYRKERDLDLQVAIGINTGVAVVGNIGSQQKMEYTAIGDAVNTASRLESAAKEMSRQIIVSEYTYVAVRNLFHFERVGEIQVKGKTDLVPAYAVEGVAETPAEG